MTREEYAAQLVAIGHFRAAAIRKDNGRFYVECECGYRSTTRTSLREAVDTVEHHRRKMLSQARAGGVSLPGSVGGRL